MKPPTPKERASCTALSVRMLLYCRLSVFRLPVSEAKARASRVPSLKPRAVWFRFSSLRSGTVWEPPRLKGGEREKRRRVMSNTMIGMAFSYYYRLNLPMYLLLNGHINFVDVQEFFFLIYFPL